MTYRELCDRVDKANIKELEQRGIKKPTSTYADETTHEQGKEIHALQRFMYVVYNDLTVEVNLVWRFCDECGKVWNESLTGHYNPTNTAYLRQVIEKGELTDEEKSKIFSKGGEHNELRKYNNTN